MDQRRDQEADDSNCRQRYKERGTRQLEADPDVHERPESEGAADSHSVGDHYQRLDSAGTQGRDLHTAVQADDGKQARVSVSCSSKNDVVNFKQNTVRLFCTYC